ncbi:glycosyltransferase involved in cell wall biosynthesis [Methylohalomonas lacus]|uniref:Glycosyltransferase involved in cell wall biosynthesis n=1 Tax=Methylohalomonas lacus TaxID=398773 RepID=A0AAE3HNG9_9GAMM|nr:glycosyltransferase family 2 protein [Methylohalomonas lacus]MCS3904379.1 glycosyltransferase involved in cell wall biosynthesis [Methylohalomonas lacus]
MDQTTLTIYVFSYNRVQFLYNCLRSIEYCAPDFRIVIIDDNSTDAATINYLQTISTKYEVIYSSVIDNYEPKVGGLYNNMEMVFRLAYENNQKYVLFIQDDMQIVRSIDREDLQSIDHFFSENENSFQLNSCFMKLKDQKEDPYYLQLDESAESYICTDSRHTKPRWFLATGVFNVNRYHALYGALERTESENNYKCRERGLVMGIAKQPFMMWLPFPRSYRKRKRSLLHNLIEYIGGTGFYPIEYLNNKFPSKTDNRMPVAEAYLTAPNIGRCLHWSTEGGVPSLLARGGWRMYLGRLIRYIKQ